MLPEITGPEVVTVANITPAATIATEEEQREHDLIAIEIRPVKEANLIRIYRLTAQTANLVTQTVTLALKSPTENTNILTVKNDSTQIKINHETTRIKPIIIKTLPQQTLITPTQHRKALPITQQTLHELQTTQKLNTIVWKNLGTKCKKWKTTRRRTLPIVPP